MTIKSFAFADRGIYRCKCYDRSRDYHFSSNIEIDVADLSTEHRLNCGQTGTNYRWKRITQGWPYNYKPIANRNHGKYANTTSRILSLLRVDRNEYGSYRCTYYNNGWHHVDFYLVVQEYPDIRFDNTQYTAAIGTSVYMTCTIRQTRPSITEVWWVKGNSRIQADERKYEVRNGTTYTSLNVLNVNTNDAGEYKCYARNARGDMFANTTLATGNLPLLPKAAKDMYRVKEGTTVSLQCDHQTSIPPITELWWQIRMSGYFYNLTNFMKYSDGTLTTPNLHIKILEDSGTYVCRVGNGIGYANFTISLVIWRRPKVVKTGKREITTGSDATFKCSFSESSPSMQSILWRKDTGTGQIVLEDGGKYVIQKTAMSTTLQIKSVTINDADTYTCIAVNKYSEGTDSFSLSVGSPPRINIIQALYIIKAGNNVNISCVVRNVPENYKYTMYWNKGSHRITHYKYNPFLIIKIAKPNDAGNYSCHVENKYGKAHDSTEIKVLSAKIREQFHEVTANDSYKINCDVSGGDRVVWRKNDKELILTNQQIYSGGNVNDPSLKFRKTSHLDRGNYSCETTYRSVTAKSTTIHLRVKDIPLVYLPNYMTEVIEGSHTILDCSYDSYPEPTKVYWKKDDKIIKLSESSRTKYNGSSVEIPVLVIHDTTQKDSGKTRKNTSTTGALVGGIFATLIAILVLIGLVVLLRRRSNNVNNIKPLRQATISYAENVELCTDGRGIRDNGLYLNVGIVSSSAMENVNPTTVPITGDNEYYNLSEVQSSCIRVEELKQYIEKKQRQEALKNEYKSIPNVAVHPTTHAQTKENMPKNRFKTTFPYDHTRVILESNGGSDYINANYVDGFEKEKCYIACQGPIKPTVADHWKMIWQENVYQIVMLTNLVEGIKIKCEQYWPSGGKQMVLGNLIIRLNVEKERTAYVTREITIEDKKTSKKRKVTQYHFTAWPDHGTPDPLYLVLFHRHVMSDTKAGHSGPLLVHCSAGIGRTGTYIALDALLEEGRTTGFLDIFKYLKKMRYSRMNMIQTANQYVCLHYTLLEAFTMKDTKIRKDKFSEVWMSISTDNRPVNHQRLDEEFKMLNAKKDEQNQTQHNAAMSTTNLAKNRNKDVLPMDDKRVYLVSYGKGRSDYINAVQVPSYTKFVGYITTQLPLPDTKVDFWTMIRDHISSTIVLIINNKKEADLVYSQSEDNVTIGEFNIKISARRVEENDITEATIVLSKKDDKPRPIVLFQVICKSIPDPAVLCKLADLISTRATMSNDPITVVSSDGAKNCGLFCAFTNAVSSMQIDNNADIFQLVRLLQLRRPEFFTDFVSTNNKLHAYN
ncbi:Tyrosine-protein phosphatase 1,Tyrosine-protein phosphatase non-receptor type 13,Tyrosine-protein phosphatase non-receptor type 7 [Mytilus edulis]|uniref:protein-tyrosine-phosphatase n=1 Tax=Mytilus edulis TaxID=6550 RepID=A0A8S3SEB1_MYTED|nr:Tyrosine-protein phosphatase 1,Tyrosine-protein phosphatase non-receptor type 13,Tyrosine-protein phosphatase non-receptor type 7 [Mytilus edulis]